MKDITEVSWVELNILLSQSYDTVELRRWIALTLKSQRKSRKYRAIRIYGRLSAVRRMEELKEIEEAA